jgi:hypothetical protein
MSFISCNTSDVLVKIIGGVKLIFLMMRVISNLILIFISQILFFFHPRNT